MRGVLCRKYHKYQTKGHFDLHDTDTSEVVFDCLTLELPFINNEQNISCIPEGTYNVESRTSNKYGDHLHITGVDGRGLILIHWGNFAGSDNPRTNHPDIRGCVLVGTSYGDINKTKDGIDEILNSKNTFKALMKVAPNGFVLEVTQ